MSRQAEAPFRPLRLPPRVLATVLGTFALLAPFSDAWGLGAAVLGAAAGVLFGEGLAYSRLSTRAAVLPSLAAGGVGFFASSVLLGQPALSALLGPPTALKCASVFGFGLGALGLIALLRTLSRRLPAAQAVEILAFGLAATSAFAAHRDGALARPLWLADRAWQLGLDPSSILLAIGASAAAGIALLQVLETRHRLPRFSWVWFPAVALACFVLADVRTTEPPPSAELEGIRSELQRPPDARGMEGTREDAGRDGNEDGGDADDRGTSSGEKASDESATGSSDEAASTGDPTRESTDGSSTSGTQAGDSEATEQGERRQQDERGSGVGNSDVTAPESGPPGDGKLPDGSQSGEADGAADGPRGDDASNAEDQDARGGGPGAEDAASSGATEPDNEDEEGSRPSSGEARDLQGEGEGSPESGAPSTSSESPAEPEDEEQPPSGQPQLEAEGAGAGSNDPVAVVILGDDYAPLAGYFYLRQGVSSEFAGTRLVPAASTELDRDVPRVFPAAPEVVTAGPPANDRAVVHGKVVTIAEHDAPFALEGLAQLEPAHNPNPARFRRAWRFVSHAPTREYEALVGGSSGSDMSEEVRAHYLAYPADDPRYSALAEQLLEALPAALAEDPFAKALAIKQHLDQMVYDTQERHATASDPTAAFLFEGEKMVGYCVHAAHASVYLLRAAGVPARVGTGYAVEEERRRGSSLVILSKDAHAWPELYLDGVGWTILDIAPSESRDPPGEPLDEDLADLLTDMAREEPEEESRASVDWRALWHATLRTLGRAAIVLLALFVEVHYLVKLWRRGRPYLASRRAMPRVAYRAVLDRLSEAGLVREEGETRERFARRIAGISPTFAILTDLHLEAMLGRPGASTGFAPALWLRTLAQVHAEVSASTGWTRLLGVMNPFSFYRSR